MNVNFSGNLATQVVQPAIDSRNLFYGLIHVGEYPAVLQAAQRFVQAQLQASVTATDNSKPYHPDTFADAFNATVHDFKQHPTPGYYLAFSPVIYTELAWLDNIVQTSNNQAPVAIALFALNLQLHQGIQSKPIVAGHLLKAGITLPELHTWAFTQQANIPDTLFEFAALQLALGQFARLFFAEILGFTYAYCQTAGPLAVLQAAPVDFVEDRQAHLRELQGIIQVYLAESPTQQAALWQRIQNGYGLYHHHLERSIQQLESQLGESLSTQQALLALLNRLRPHAIGHHGNIHLAGQSIDAWFQQTPFDGDGFLQALKQSGYIDPEHPENSRLLKLFEFKGPMFGVLHAEELALLKRWVCADQNNVESRVSNTFLPSVEFTHWQKSPAHPTKLNNRDWYYTLVNIEQFPNALSAAKQRVQRLLKLCQWFSRLPFKQYTHQAFDDFIAATYQREVSRYKPLTTPSISKQTYIWGIEQLAPAILTDGCWLQNVQQLQYLPSHTVGNWLSKIYSDELGGGILTQNHPYIYQQLLTSVGLKLPPADSEAFSQHPGFIDSAFNIPNYLMAISKFPSAFLPELLGLNMAIELSGLGRVYLRLAQALKFYDLDPTIVNVHISIDNVATGHSALAQQAIRTYLDDMLAVAGNTVMQQHWQRIYTGYCSLAWATHRFSVALVGHGLLRYGSKSPSQCLKSNPSP